LLEKAGSRRLRCVAESIEVLERRIDELRAAVRRAAVAGDRAQAREMRADLRRAEQAWEHALTALEPGPQAPSTPVPLASLLPLREQVHHALTLLAVPAAPRLIVAVHEAFFSGDMVSARLTSLRRDEERSFRSAPYARPYYLCPALTADLLAPARGLLTVSTWSTADRIVGPLSPRVHYLTAAIQVADAIARLDEPRPHADRLLWRFAANIPGASDGAHTSASVAKAARAELVIHEEADQYARDEAAKRAARLTEVQRLFGARIGLVDDAAATG
jgi:hypothetical protein